MNKKVLVRLICVLLIVILFLGIIALILRPKNKANNQTEQNQEVIVPVDENVIIPANSYLFFGKYIHGEITSKAIYNTISYFGKTIMPKYNSALKDANDSEIMAYYDNNRTEIYKFLNISSKEDFITYIKAFKVLNLDSAELVSIKFVEDSFKVNSDSTDAKIIFTYDKDRNFETNVKVYKKAQPLNRNIVFYNK